MFFSLSGFIFYWLYAAQIAERNLSIKEFSLFRFSRLYPLHLLTLLLVAIGQILFGHVAKTYFVFPFNDRFHFILNLFFASAWGLEKGGSFNGPSWSVSIEIILYALFYALCRMLPVRMPVLLLVSMLGFIISRSVNQQLGRGLISFFLGGCVYLIYQQIISRGLIQQSLKTLRRLFVPLWILAIVAIFDKWDLNVAFLGHLMTIYAVAILFPVTILTLSLLETQRGSFGKRLSGLGNISYSSYLLHFPLQLFMVTITTSFGMSRSVFYSPYSLMFFLAILFALSYASYFYFERPLQDFIRRRWLATQTKRKVKSKPFTIAPVNH